MSKNSKDRVTEFFILIIFGRIGKYFGFLFILHMPPVSTTTFVLS